MQIYPSFLNSLGQVNADGTEVFGSGAKASKAGLGQYNLALDSQADSSEIAVVVGFIGNGQGGAAGLSYSWKGTDDGNVLIETFACSDEESETPTPCSVPADAAFSYLIFQKPST